MPIKVTYQNPGLEYDENMVCEDFLNMGMLPLEPLLKSRDPHLAGGEKTLASKSRNPLVPRLPGIREVNITMATSPAGFVRNDQMAENIRSKSYFPVTDQGLLMHAESSKAQKMVQKKVNSVSCAQESRRHRGIGGMFRGLGLVGLSDSSVDITSP